MTTVLDKAPFGFAYLKIILGENNEPIDYSFIEVNKLFEKITGFESEDIIGKHLSELTSMANSLDLDWNAVYKPSNYKDDNNGFEWYSKLLKRWYNIEVYSPEEGYLSTVYTDISSRIP
ncbi:MAG: PAS domain S-box protein, partial [Melioribacteraceae bacterium]